MAKALLLTIQFAAITHLASAVNLYVSSYAGTVTSLSLTELNGTFSLTQTYVSYGCAPNPSWLTYDQPRGVLYCLNEGLLTPNGSLASFTTSPSGELAFVQNTTTITGPVSGIVYGQPNGARAIALAYYAGAAVSTFTLHDSSNANSSDNGSTSASGSSGSYGSFTPLENITFSLSAPGPVPDRQATPHEHEAITDPTGQYILVPDLGADLVRVFSYDPTSLLLTERASLVATPGSGPRHAAFWNPYGIACESCSTFLYVVGELGGTITGYRVGYLANGTGLEFTQVYQGSTFGYLLQPAGAAPAEVHVAPGNRHLIISNRNDTSFQVSNPNATANPPNTTAIPSDSLSTFMLKNDGTLSFTQLAPAYGSFPRQFTTNAVGNLVAVGLQYSSEVVILSRCLVTGLIGEVVARISIAGQITSVVWDEQYALGRLGM